MGGGGPEKTGWNHGECDLMMKSEMVDVSVDYGAKFW